MPGRCDGVYDDIVFLSEPPAAAHGLIIAFEAVRREICHAAATHFAEIDSNNKVLRVLVVDNSEEHRGQEFLANDLGAIFLLVVSTLGLVRALEAGGFGFSALGAESLCSGV